MEFLQSLLDNTSAPILYAFIIGLMTSISPCPLATNITAIGYISKEIENKRQIFLNGILYTLGRAISYTGLGVILYFGASKFQVAKLFQTYGERFLGPLLIVIGVLMLDVIHLKFPEFGGLTNKIQGNLKKGNALGALLLGMLFSLAFCPYSGVLYFGMLIPMTISSASGLYLPVVFAFATGLPVILFAWLLAYSVASVGEFYNKIKLFQKWFNLVIAVLFILVGLYYTIKFFV